MNHLYHKGVKLTRECMSCMGRGQLKAGYLDHLQFSVNAEVPSKPIDVDILIIMCTECDGNGIVMHHDTWMKFRMYNSCDVVYQVEKFVEEHLKPEYDQ